MGCQAVWAHSRSLPLILGFLHHEKAFIQQAIDGYARTGSCTFAVLHLATGNCQQCSTPESRSIEPTINDQRPSSGPAGAEEFLCS